jgi:ABC-2 type transport system ATP-binding protein
MSILSLRNVMKTYGNHIAVNDVSFEMEKGKIFGLLGPNGAGKTTLIRMITSITRADEGQIVIDGQALNENHPTQIGYLPEERGLYKKMKVGEQLLYLARLKGLSAKDARDKLNHWLEKFEITDWWDKKVEELSKGMQQKVQFISTVVHEPKLMILDEPFSGLDPVNTNLIKDEINNLNQNGTSIIFSTHRMEQVEEICEDMVLINQGQIVLDGSVKAVKDSYKENKFEITFDGNFPKEIADQGFTIVDDNDSSVIIQANPGHNSNDLLRGLINRGIHIKAYREILPTLNEIFIRKVAESNG